MPRSTPRRFRLHLSTALLLTLVAAVLMYVQTVPVAGDPTTELLDENWRYLSDVLPVQDTSRKQISVMEPNKNVEIDSQDALDLFRESAAHGGYKVDCYGWPFHAILKWKDSTRSQSFIWVRACMFDALTGMLILAFIWWETEYWIAARAARIANS